MNRKSIIALMLLACVMLSLASCTARMGNKVAVISLNGPIMAESGSPLFGGSAITPGLVRNELRKVMADPAVKAVVIQVNSPGGDISACQEIVYELDKIKQPIVISMRTIATSGGYYISANADKIVALPSTLTGSIGVISEIPNLKGLFDKLGIQMEIIKAGKYKDMYSGFHELTSEERGIVQKTTDQMYQQFIKTVAQGRNIDEVKVKEMATGQLFTGLEAKELGLVDEIGGLQTAVDIAAGLANISQPQVEYYKQDTPDLFKLIFGINTGAFFDLVNAKFMGSEGYIISDILNNPYPRFFYK
ncbi:MAG: signal peptide peptidase SppA [Chloroflexi bacterium]|nr:signal peptide peptidase SppA [Chloroflexota bacterium]